MASADAPWLLGASGQVGYFLQQRCGDALVPCVRSVPRWATDRTRHWRLFDLWRSNEAPTCARLISAGPLDACIDWLSRSGPGALQRIVALSSMSVLHKQSSTSVQERDIAQRFEGHVPASEVQRLLRERPPALGLVVPGMPIASPGMDTPAYGGRRDAYSVLLLGKDGQTSGYASYGARAPG